MKCKRCEHEWEYKGKSEWYATCPKCYRKIKIIEKEVKRNE